MVVMIVGFGRSISALTIKWSIVITQDVSIIQDISTIQNIITVRTIGGIKLAITII